MNKKVSYSYCSIAKKLIPQLLSLNLCLHDLQSCHYNIVRQCCVGILMCTTGEFSTQLQIDVLITFTEFACLQPCHDYTVSKVITYTFPRTGVKSIMSLTIYSGLMDHVLLVALTI